MDLVYRILCIDDNISDLDGIKKLVEKSLIPFGFELDLKFEDTIKSEEDIEKTLKSLRAYNPYDLIMVDYDLGFNLGGASVLRRLRNVTSGIMVFYSGSDVKILRANVCNEGIDGIYCLSRTALRNQLFPIIQASLGKISTPMIIRGLVVGTVGEIDGLLSEIVLKLIDNVKAGSNPTLIQDMRSRHELFLQDTVKGLDEFYQKPIAKLVRNINLQQKQELLTPILNGIGCQVSSSCLQAINDLLERVNQVRIDLAHYETVVVNGLPYVKRKSGGEYKPEDLLEHLRRLSLIRQSILNAKEYYFNHY